LGVGIVEYEITRACNLRCIHCYNRSGENPEKVLDLGTVERMMIDLKNLGIRFLDIIGGEPLVYPHLLKVLELAKANDLKAMINTNGVLATREMVKRIKEVYPDLLVGVSLDGSSETLNDTIRGKGTFKKAVRGILNFLEEGFDVTMLFIVNKLNWFDFGNYVEFAKSLGVSHIYVDRFIPMGRGLDNYGILGMDPEMMRIAVDYILEIVREEKEVYFYLEESIGGGRCPAGFSHFSILVDGTVVPCGHFRYDERFHIGNITKDKLSNIFEKGKSFFRNRKFRGCRACSYLRKGDPEESDPVLELIRMNNEE